MKEQLTKHESKLVQAMDLLGDKTRFMMFKLICNGHNYCVSDLAQRLGVTPSAISQHFQSFELLGLLRRERVGQKICYTLNRSDLVQTLCSVLHNHQQ